MKIREIKIEREIGTETMGGKTIQREREREKKERGREKKIE